MQFLRYLTYALFKYVSCGSRWNPQKLLQQSDQQIPKSGENYSEKLLFAPNDHLELPTFEQRHRTLFPNRKPLRKWEGGSRPSDLRIGRSESPLRHRVELQLPSCPLASIIRRLVAFEEGGENSSIATVASEIRRPIAGRERRAMLNLSRQMGRSDGNWCTWHVDVKSSHHRRGTRQVLASGGLSHAVVCFSYLSSIWDTLVGPPWSWALWMRWRSSAALFGPFPSSDCCFLFLSSDMASDWWGVLPACTVEAFPLSLFPCFMIL